MQKRQTIKHLILIIGCLAVTSPAFANNDKAKGPKPRPPGLEKKVDRGGQLPPGWQKKLVKGKTIDPQLYNSAVKFTGKGNKKVLKPIVGTDLLQIDNRIIRIRNDTINTDNCFQFRQLDHGSTAQQDMQS